ncbi:Short-chain dehydrogenase/reductase SDR [hydrothermal vent metagenome]|uniref:Short-chain dehydrogenase/reductase SDR n=1 Tax=hydrothermal vent metagenome TaxID=652676 RepID=A0A3B1CJP3_9ZZZZ
MADKKTNDGAKQRVALVTGASSGVGAAVAARLAKDGYALALGARRKERLESVAESIKTDTGISSFVCELDLRSPASISGFAEKVFTEFGHVDVLVNCAGLALGRETADQADVEDWMNMIETDYSGPIRLIRELLPKFKERGAGHIVNIGALAALSPHPGSAVYASAKEAMRMFLKCLREDILGSGVRVTNIDPGIVRTDFALVRFRGDEKSVEKMLEGLRPLEPEDVADCVWFAVSRPAHVNIDQISALPTDQTSPTRVHRAT